MASDSAASESAAFDMDLQRLKAAAGDPLKPALRVRTSVLGKTTMACPVNPQSQVPSAKTSAHSEPMNALTDFVQGVEIYSGRETRVISCLTKLTRTPVVVKVSAKAGLSARQRALVENEMRLSKKLAGHRHPGLVTLLNSFEDAYNYYQVLENCEGGNLYDLLHSSDSPLSEEEVCIKVLRPLLDSLAFIHRLQIVHRDIKLENLLLSDGHLKLGDFGLAVDLAEELPRIRVGTIDYNAPEVTVQPCAEELEAQDPAFVPAYDHKVDVWAAGVVAYELLVGHPPFYMPDVADTNALIRDGALPGFLGFLSDDCVDFLQAALRKNPEERPSAEELLQHPWLTYHAAGQKGSWEESRLGSAKLQKPAESHMSSTHRLAAVSTFATPNPSMSPRLGTWKIQTQVSGDYTPSSAVSLHHEAAAKSVRSRLSWVHREPSQDLQDTAEDIQPRDLPYTSANGRPVRTLSYVEVAPQLEVLREEVAESACGGPVEVDVGSEATALPIYLMPAQLRRSMSAGKSRFA